MKNSLTSRLNFAAMATTYCLGTFNDNFFKQAAMLIAVSAGMSQLQGWATVLFALPFILFSAFGGWCADTFPKRTVIVISKAFEAFAMVIGGIGLLVQSWPLILTMVFLMGLQSTFFSPALNGSIPEFYTSDQVPRVNGILKMATTLTILLGIALAGICLDQNWLDPASLPQLTDSPVSFGVNLVALIAIVVAVVGFAVSFLLRRNPAAGGTCSFPWSGPIRSLADLVAISSDRQLLLGVICDAWFYFISVLAIQLINTLGIDQFHFSQSRTSLLAMSLMLGVCGGSLIAAKITAVQQWSRWLPHSGAGMGLGLVLAGLAALLPDAARFPWLLVTLTSAGCAGGIFIIPTATVLQVRPKETEKGRVLAVASFCSFITILLAGLLFTVINGRLPSSILMSFAGAGAILFALLLILMVQRAAQPPTAGTRRILAALLRRILALRYRVEVEGLDTIEKRGSTGILFLPNHPALIDPVIISSQLLDRFAPRPLSDENQIAHPLVRLATNVVNPITIPDSGDGSSARRGILKGMQLVVDALSQGDNILLYPAGRLNRGPEEKLGATSGVEYLLRKIPQLQVVTVRSNGLWGSSFGHASAPPTLFTGLWRYLAAAAAGLLFFIPKRPVQLTFKQDDKINHLHERHDINRHLEAFYNALPVRAERWPLFWWQGSEPELLPVAGEKEDDAAGLSEILESIDKNLRREVIAEVSRITGCSVSGPEKLSDELGMDSLSQMELAGWIESHYGVVIEDPGQLTTVDHCVLAAAGTVFGGIDTVISPGRRWFDEVENFSLPAGDGSIGELFLHRAQETPKQIIVADRTGERSYRDLLTATLLLHPLLTKVKEERVGIMLPASVSAAIAWLALLLSGKTPVMFNWTGGRKNMLHGIELTGVKTILSAEQLCTRLDDIHGLRLAELGVEWLHLDRIFPRFTTAAKLSARMRSNFFGIRQLRRTLKKETAVILFTSGSEAAPKAVPLSHQNIVANLSDIGRMLHFTREDRLIGFLPPFHSLGLTATIALPLLTGIKTVYHPNPTEPVAIARLINAFGVTLTATTPSFLAAILRAADGDQLRSLRTIFAGAEGVPEGLPERLAQKAPQAQLCEGYGVTECSPVISVNPPEENRRGTIGRPLPAVEWVVVDDAIENEVAAGCRGLLLVRGANTFAGYYGLPAGRGFVEFGGKTWYDTGDFVSVEDGFFTFCGRRKRFVKIAGEMVSLPAIEAALQESADGPGLAVVAAGGDGHPELVLITTGEAGAPSLETANARIRAAGLSPLHTLRRRIRIEEIPLLGSGKTDYTRLGEIVAEMVS